MDVKQAQQSTRPPPRLRVKTGCQTCLKRRKKCPENRPVCATCERLRLSCVYRDSAPPATSDLVPVKAQAVSSVAESPPGLLPLTASLSIRPEGLRTARDWNVFNYCATKYMSVITSPESLSKFRDLSFVFAIGYDKPWVVHAALAPAALHASFSSLVTKEDAVLYTQSAIRGLRQSLLPSRPVTLRRDPCLATSLFLADFYLSPFNAGLTHHQAIAQLLEAQFAASSRLDIKSLSILHLTLLDASLYHLSTRLILEKDIDAIWDAFPSATFSKYIEAHESEARDVNAQRPILPVLGRTPPALFVLIFQVTWLSRKVPSPGDEHYGHAFQYLIELDRIEDNYPGVRSEENTVLGAHGTAASHNSELAAKLYFLAAQIFVAKVVNPHGVTSTSTQIQTLLIKGMALLELFDPTVPCGQFICWPLLILGCAACATTASEAVQCSDEPEVRRGQMRRLIQERLLRIWNVSYSGYVQRTLGALEKVWKLPGIIARIPTTGSQLPGVEAEYDGLNALLSKNGLGVAFPAGNFRRLI
ncbi:hypothetical protein G647_04375 [Cladophialophora carrionii CBS 160.54]|uniref:Zn(2)-C6 fungal-type domain-containing protein n=1 Tax=Cladophialophora carrionii CBS 160.54 TaxID=1279043 RepID=V9DDT6_9EURO|nr:uncharacterized protein G647_04375 [Cladophialophora carrionii CBS 160.54]ETI25005.1 hypothetical protein G647_04375 [Cladophialophora carrionii CBS 160.54]